jgi:hypothetical protein
MIEYFNINMLIRTFESTTLQHVMKQYQFKLIFFSIYHNLQHTTRSHMDKHQHNNLILDWQKLIGQIISLYTLHINYQTLFVNLSIQIIKCIIIILLQQGKKMVGPICFQNLVHPMLLCTIVNWFLRSSSLGVAMNYYCKFFLWELCLLGVIVNNELIFWEFCSLCVTVNWTGFLNFSTFLSYKWRPMKCLGLDVSNLFFFFWKMVQNT